MFLLWENTDSGPMRVGPEEGFADLVTATSEAHAYADTDLVQVFIKDSSGNLLETIDPVVVNGSLLCDSLRENLLDAQAVLDAGVCLVNGELQISPMRKLKSGDRIKITKPILNEWVIQ